MQNTRLAVFQLIVANFFWGFGFIPSVWVLGSLHPAAIIFYRFLGAGLATIAIFLVSKTKFPPLGESLRIGFIPGIFLALTLVLQAWGLKYTTATKSAFITILYVIFVPIMAALLVAWPL